MKNHVKFTVGVVLAVALVFAFAGCGDGGDTPPDGSGSGSLTDPFIVGSEGSLIKVGSGEDGWELNSHYRQSANITLSILWTPIGTDTDPFSGSFKGEGHTISRLRIMRSADYNGLFGCIDGGTVSNLNLTEVDINISGASGFTGAVAGHNKGVVEHCDVSVAGGAAIKCPAQVGGVVGTNEGTVEHCTVSGTVTGEYGVGGVVGINGGTVQNCTASGSVKGTLMTMGAPGAVGGVAGVNQGQVQHCTSSCSVEGISFEILGIGGVVGLNMIGTVQNCASLDDVKGITLFTLESSLVGGVVGVNYAGTVQNCYSTGKVEGKDYIGGVVGANYAGTVENCYATGDVSGAERVGGVVGGNINAGSLPGKVMNCYATGDVSGAERVGGIVGFNSEECSVAHCYSTGKVSGDTGVGGIVGSSDYSNGARVQNCVALGDEVKAESSPVWRAIGIRSGTGAEDRNFANKAMLIIIGAGPGAAISGITDPTLVQGADVEAGANAGQFNNKTFWSGTVGFNFDGPWKWDNASNLPVLK